MATEKVVPDANKTEVLNANEQRKMADLAKEQRDSKRDAELSKKFGLGDSPSKDFSGSKYYKLGGAVKSSASSKADGCAQCGKTKGRFV